MAKVDDVYIAWTRLYQHFLTPVTQKTPEQEADILAIEEFFEKSITPLIVEDEMKLDG